MGASPDSDLTGSMDYGALIYRPWQDAWQKYNYITILSLRISKLIAGAIARSIVSLLFSKFWRRAIIFVE